MPIDSTQVHIEPVSVPTSADPGETVTATVQLTNDASHIPDDETRVCDGPWPGATGIAVEASATVGAGNTVATKELCLLPSDSIQVELTFQVPMEDGVYPTSYTASSVPGDIPMVWGSTTHEINVSEGGGGIGGMDTKTFLLVAGGAIAAGELLYSRYADE